jgi:hypothetical protein
MNNDSLKNAIERERSKLHTLVARYGLNDERSLQQSWKLDQLIVKAQKNKVRLKCTQ